MRCRDMMVAADTRFHMVDTDTVRVADAVVGNHVGVNSLGNGDASHTRILPVSCKLYNYILHTYNKFHVSIENFW